MKVVVVGGVAGGMSFAARARRLAEDAEIVVLERDPYVSYANCGLPYHLGGEIADRDALLLHTPQSLAASLALDVRTGHEVLAIDPAGRTVTVRERATGRDYHEAYDALVLSTGAAPVIPPIPGAGLPAVRVLRTVPDVDVLRELVDGGARRAVIADTKAGTKETIDYDLLHAVPPQSAPDWVKDSPLADPAVPAGYIKADKHTLVHPGWPNVFTLGDAANLPTSKTGAAARKQSPVLVANLIAAMGGRPAAARYNGYTSCPLVTSRHRMLLAEFDYDLKPTPSIPLINTMKPRYDMWLLKRYGLPALYWHLMLRGRA